MSDDTTTQAIDAIYDDLIKGYKSHQWYDDDGNGHALYEISDRAHGLIVKSKQEQSDE